MKWGLNGVAWLMRKILSLRYRIETKGLDALTLPRPEYGVLFLPNHPAEIDPVMVETLLWKRYSPRPLIVEHFYDLKGFKWLMRWVGALPLPTMDRQANARRGKKVKQKFQQVVDELQRGGHLLIYPSGRLKATEDERLEGASFVHDLLQAAPDVNVVLVRTTGLWGSLFSKALTGKSPDFVSVLKHCLWILLKNGIFFVPRRRVCIEFEVAPVDFPRQGTRLDLNRFLERWYNRYPDPLQRVSLSFWKEDLPEMVAPKDKPTERTLPTQEVSDEVRKSVGNELSRLALRPASQIDGSMQLTRDLGLDSLDITQIHLFLDTHYDVKELEPDALIQVADVWAAAMGFLSPKTLSFAEMGKFHYPKEPNRQAPALPEMGSVPETFLSMCNQMGSAFACVDSLSGVWSYRRLKRAVLVLCQYFRHLPGERIGVMLPSSVIAYCVVLALMLARKVPVMINWTSGKKALDHVVEATGIHQVITSEKFLDRIEDPDLGSIEELWLPLEKVRSQISLCHKLTGMWHSVRCMWSLRRIYRLKEFSLSDPAVILFTSGTESLPKGVPLSHQNILSNQRAALACVHLSGSDVLYGVLPPFHSFGLVVTGLLPLLAGLKVCYAPDPTDSHGMARDVQRWQPTLFCCAPTFIRALFAVTDPKALSSLKWVVSGAEKTPQALFDFVATHLPSCVLMEGYGITECSPIVSLDRMGEIHCGVGKPLPGVDIVIFDPATLTEVPLGQEGEIGIAGKSVFNGYLGSQKDPFVMIGGRQFYASGDRGKRDQEGHLILSGRLKRFVKMGGEMVSLGGIEEELSLIAQEKGWISGREEAPTLAITAREADTDRPELILFATFPVSKEEINTALRGRGFSRLIKIGEICKIDAIPLMGTGKINYRQLI